MLLIFGNPQTMSKIMAPYPKTESMSSAGSLILGTLWKSRRPEASELSQLPQAKGMWLRGSRATIYAA